ncbi:putative ribonuclease H-like domain-containing protein [Tanacetum coccineum]
MALMAFSDSEVYNDKTCSKTYLKNYETLKKQYDDLIVKLNQTELTTTTYKRGLATVEEQLITYRNNELLFSEEVTVLKREVACKDYEINVLKKSQITDKSKKGLAYTAVPPPHPLIYNRPKKLDLSYSGLDEFKEPEFKGYGYENSSVQIPSKGKDGPVNAVRAKGGKPQQDNTGFVDSGCTRHMTGNIAYLSDFKKFNGDYVTFRGGVHGGRISGKGTLKTDSLDFNDVYFVNELKLNLFSVSQMCDKKNYVLFTDTECLVLSPNFKLPDENQILLKIPRKDNMYSFDMKNIVPKESLTCLVAKATLDESMLWHMRLGHINFKNINKLVKDNLERGLPTKHFENDQTCVAYLKGSNTELLDETSEILKNFIKEIENLVDKKVKIIRSDNGTEFKNKVMDDFCREKCIKREYSIARTPQQNGVAERSLGKFDGKSDECFFVGYSLSSKAFRLFDIDSLTQSMNYVPVAAGTIINESAGTQRELNVGTSEEISQDCIMMPIWKVALYFDSPSKDVDNNEPKSAADDQKQTEDGPDNDSDEKEKYEDDSSPKEINTARQHVNTASPEVNTGRFKHNTVGPSVNTASSYDQDSPKDMFTMGASHTLEATHVEFFSDEDEPEVDLRNIINSYTVWILVDFPIGKRSIGTKWVFRNKKDERGIVIRNKARLVAQGHIQEEGIDYEEFFALVARIEAIRLFLAYASFIGFLVYQMDVNSALLYGTIE